MPSAVITFEGNAKGVEASLKGLETGLDGVGKAAKKSNETLKTWSMEQQRAAMKMEKLHEEALKMNLGFKSADDKAQLFAATLSKMSSTMSTTAAAFGMPIGPLNALNQATDVAALGFGQLTKSAIGFNTATLGVVGAGLAIGGAIGTLLRQIPFLEKAFDGAAEAAWRLVTGIETADATAGLEDFQKRMAPGADLAAKATVDAYRAQGKSLEEIRKIYEEMPPAIERYIDSLEKQEKVTKKVTEATDKNAKAIAEANAQLAEQQHAALISGLNEYIQLYGDARKREEDIDKHLWDEKKKLWKDSADAQKKAYDQMVDAVQKYAEAIDEAAKKEKEAKRQHQVDLIELYGSIAASLVEIGVSGSNAFVQIASGLEAGTAAALRFRDATTGIQKALAVIDAARAAYKSGSFLGGAATGAAFGAQFGVWGAVAGGLAGGILGLFGGGRRRREEAERARREAEEAQRRIDEGARASRAAGIEGIEKFGPEFFMQRTILTEEDARRQGVLFAAAWGAMVKEKGIVAAADAFKEAFEKMRTDMEAAGIDKPAWFTDIETLMDLGLDEEFRNLAEAANTAAQFLKALGEAGVLGPEAIAAMEEEVMRLFLGGKTRAEELGKTPEEAQRAGFAVANPLLKELLNQSILQNTTLSPETEALIKEGHIVPDVEFQQLDELRNIRRAVQALAGLGTDGGLNGLPDGGVPGIPHDHGRFQAAAGFGPKMLARDMLIQAHAGEFAMIIPADRARRMGYLSADEGFFTVGSGLTGSGGGNGFDVVGELGGTTQTGEVTDFVETVISKAVEAASKTRPISVNSPTSVNIDENPLSTKERQEELQRFQAEHLNTLLRQRNAELLFNIRQALNLGG